MKTGEAIKLDKRDLRILNELQSDAHITYRNLSDRVALSPSACVARVKQLEGAGVITGYHAAVSIDLVRPTILMVVEISLSSHRPEDLSRFDNFLLSMPEVIEALRVNGPFDYVVRISLPSIREWQEFTQRILKPDLHVEKMVSQIVMEELKPFTGHVFGG